MIRSESRNGLVSGLVFFSFVIYVFFPNAIFGFKYNTVFLLLSVFFTFMYACSNKFFIFDRACKLSIFCFFVFLLFVKSAYFFNLEGGRFSDFVRFIFYCCCFFLGIYFSDEHSKYHSVVRYMLLTQVLVVITQIISPDFSALLYDATKVGYIGDTHSQFRHTGTLYNPNTLGVFFAFVMSILITKRNRWLSYFTLLSLVFLSGSRTGFIMALAVSVVYELMVDFSKKKLVGLVVLSLVVTMIFGVFLYYNADRFYYFAQIALVVHDLFSGEGFSAFYQVTSLMKRFDNWLGLFHDFVDGGVWVYFFGVPDLHSNRFVDNSYLYILFKYGLVFGGAIVYMIFKVIANSLVKLRGRDTIFGAVMFYLFAFLSGLFSDVLVSYYFWIMILSYTLFAQNMSRVTHAKD